jgi:hypothetical protein
VELHDLETGAHRLLYHHFNLIHVVSASVNAEKTLLGVYSSLFLAQICVGADAVFSVHHCDPER